MLGWIIAGAAAAYVGKKIYDSNKEPSIEDYPIYPGIYKQSNNNSSYKQSNNNHSNYRVNIRQTYYRQNNRQTDYHTKVDFFDDYREADCNIARCVGCGSGGIGMMILSLQNYYRKNPYKNRQLLYNLKDCRNYRIRLSHDRSKWRHIPNPSQKVLNQISRIAKWSRNTYEVQKILRYFPGKIHRKQYRHNWY